VAGAAPWAPDAPPIEACREPTLPRAPPPPPSLPPPRSSQWGRRPLLLAGVSGMVAALLALGSAQAGGGAAGAAAWVSVGALLLYVGCYQVSFGPISWLM
jgi:hypothetical protein